ncbi:hypothetical protein [Acrocarpospora catenulata]|uniref:hypothetical protein n=1 Tax=Acrocarpospora catenulata TaxID=2836182 RepID=UPI001BDA939B|nr:hypothetical protein [Acrocarpospora catenulata]
MPGSASTRSSASRTSRRSTVAAIPRYLIVASGSVDLGVHPEELLAAARAEDRLWVIEGGHDLMITAPRAVADSLAQIAAEGTV